MDEFNSLHWAPWIKELAKAYSATIDSQVVVYYESFVDSALKEYSRRRLLLREDIFGKNCPADKRIDGHKVTALYIQVFLEQPIFNVSDNVKPGEVFSRKNIMVNEMFCYDFMCNVFERWYAPIDEDVFGKVYKIPFLKLLYNYRVYFKKHNLKDIKYTKNSEMDSRYNLFTYKLANLMYFIEKNYTVRI
jgi:hypothetical protein